MSNICYDETNIAMYRIILQKTIKKILNKIGISDEGIKWVVFDEKKYMKKDVLPSAVTLRDYYRYGYCNVGEKIIGISTAAIMKGAVYDLPTITQRGLVQQKSDFLVNVILDELAHITTKRNHGDKVYDDTLSYYYRRYYGEIPYAMVVSDKNSI